MADRTWYSKEKADEVFATKREVDALKSNLEGRVPDTSTLATKDEVSRGDDALSSRIDAVKATADGALQSSSAAVTYSTKEEALATERKLGERIDSAVSTAATKNELAKYATTTSVAETYATKESLGSYLKTEDAASTYATKAALAQAQLSGGGGAAHGRHNRAERANERTDHRHADGQLAGEQAGQHPDHAGGGRDERGQLSDHVDKHRHQIGGDLGQRRHQRDKRGDDRQDRGHQGR